MSQVAPLESIGTQHPAAWLRRAFQLLLGLVVTLSFVAGGFVAHGRAVTAQQFQWGVMIRPFALETPVTVTNYDARAAVVAQLALAHSLGATTVRIELEADRVLTADMLRLAHRAGLTTVLVVDRPDKDFASVSTDFARLGRELGQEVTRDYAGLVDVWQVANEVTGSAVSQPGDGGPTIPNRYNLTFDRQRYAHVRDYTRAMGEAIRAAEPTARLMLTGHWVLVDIFPLLERDGVPFDIVGWDWYSDQGDDPSDRVIDEGGTLNLPEFFALLGKEFWIAELNYESGSFEHTEREQAAWFDRVGRSLTTNPHISGAIVHMLPDMATEVLSHRPTGFLGLVPVTVDVRGTATFGPPKPAFRVYQRLITRRPFIDPARLFTPLDGFSLAVARWRPTGAP